MPADVERAAREHFLRVIASDDEPEDLDLELDMNREYGLTSLNKVLFLTSVCETTGVPLSAFTEQDLAGMRTLRDVTDALARNVGSTA
ncbi:MULTISPECIES: acyl carrier protein [Actinomadura]|uniref:Acyl carrier protein n=1 Tax=Actinomadura yumaensis TaxID=111807 RepID=A0ABW2CFQ4_9ACTN|nr:acyl carrier protein [Actinomadura sp. J1-007]MWK34986.1 acyl carrier protein [Actinomadura sp. J1-007]